MEKNTRIEAAAAYILMARIIEGSINSVFSAVGFNFMALSLIDIVIYVFAGVYFFICYGFRRADSIYMKKEYQTNLIIIFVLIVLFIYSAERYQVVRKEYTMSFLYLITFGMLFLMIGNSKLDYAVLFEKLKPGIVFALIYAIVYMLFFTYKGHMTMSYTILPWSIVSLIFFKLNGEKKYLISAGILSFIILIGGSRGPLLCFFVAALLISVFFEGKFDHKFVIKLLILILLGIVLLLIMDKVLIVLSSAFPKARTIQYLISGKIADDSSRLKIYKYLISDVIKNPFSFRGLYADRVMIGTEFYGSDTLGIWVTDTGRYNHYAHNLFVELLYEFGIIPGGILCIFLGISIVRVLRYAYISKNQWHKMFSVLILIVGFLPLMLSSSYLISYDFWLFLGFSIKPKQRFLDANDSDDIQGE